MTDNSTQMNQDRANLPPSVQILVNTIHDHLTTCSPEFTCAEFVERLLPTLDLDVERLELGRIQHTANQATILVYLPWNTCTPFVTWAEGKDGLTYWGHYHDNLRAAVNDFKTR